MYVPFCYVDMFIAEAGGIVICVDSPQYNAISRYDE
jgi:hypothetical protein